MQNVHSLFLIPVEGFLRGTFQKKHHYRLGLCCLYARQYIFLDTLRWHQRYKFFVFAKLQNNLSPPDELSSYEQLRDTRPVGVKLQPLFELAIFLDIVGLEFDVHSVKLVHKKLAGLTHWC